MVELKTVDGIEEIIVDLPEARVIISSDTAYFGIRRPKYIEVRREGVVYRGDFRNGAFYEGKTLIGKPRWEDRNRFGIELAWGLSGDESLKQAANGNHGEYFTSRWISEKLVQRGLPSQQQLM
jgi:hypothetical protein